MQQMPTWGWIIFGVGLLSLLAIDIFVHRGARHDSRRQAIIWSIIWITAGVGFSAFVWFMYDVRTAEEYLAAYLIEESLSLDNLFVFLIIFKSLNIGKQYQRTALSWGIFGALVFRAIFIFAGAAALERWQWVEYIFSAILLYVAYRTFREDPSVESQSETVQWLSRHLPVSRNTKTSLFLARENGRIVVTPLLVAVLGLELSDIMFAIDSVPAALSVTRNEFVVYSSNAFACLGLRSLYLVLAHTIASMKYLHYGLSAVLAFAALKLLIHHWITIPPLLSITIIVLCISTATWASLRAKSLTEESPSEEPMAEVDAK